MSTQRSLNLDNLDETQHRSDIPPKQLNHTPLDETQADNNTLGTKKKTHRASPKHIVEKQKSK